MIWNIYLKLGPLAHPTKVFLTPLSTGSTLWDKKEGKIHTSPTPNLA